MSHGRGRPAFTKFADEPVDNRRLHLPPYPFDLALYYRPLLGRALWALRSLGLMPPPLEDVLIEVAEGVVQMVPPTIRPTPRVLTLPAKLLRALRADPEAWLAECRATLVARAERIDAEDLTGLSDAAILDRIEAADYDVFSVRARVPTWRKARTAARILITGP